MAEPPPQAGSIAQREDSGGPPERRTLLARIVGRESSQAAPYLRAILAGLKEAGAKQLEQFPVLGPLLSGAGAALLELSSEEADAIFEERLAQTRSHTSGVFGDLAFYSQNGLHGLPTGNSLPRVSGETPRRFTPGRSVPASWGVSTEGPWGRRRLAHLRYHSPLPPSAPSEVPAGT